MSVIASERGSVFADVGPSEGIKECVCMRERERERERERDIGNVLIQSSLPCSFPFIVSSNFYFTF